MNTLPPEASALVTIFTASGLPTIGSDVERIIGVLDHYTKESALRTVNYLAGKGEEVRSIDPTEREKLTALIRAYNMYQGQIAKSGKIQPQAIPLAIGYIYELLGAFPKPALNPTHIKTRTPKDTVIELCSVMIEIGSFSDLHASELHTSQKREQYARLDHLLSLDEGIILSQELMNPVYLQQGMQCLRELLDFDPSTLNT